MPEGKTGEGIAADPPFIIAKREASVEEAKKLADFMQKRFHEKT